MKKIDKLLFIVPPIGFLIWIGFPIFTHKEEAWDSGIYLPVIITICLALGVCKEKFTWVWGLLLLIPQVLLLIFQGGLNSKFGPYIPMGCMGFYIVLCILSSYVGKLLRKLFTQKSEPVTSS